MWEDRMPMMHAMIGLVKECERNQSAKPPVGNNTPSAAVHAGTRESNVLNVFAQTLHIGGQKDGRQIQP